MSQEISKVVVSSALASGSGVVTMVLKFFDSNATAIGAISTVVFGLIYVYFQFSSSKKLTIADENKEDLTVVKENMNKLELAMIAHKNETATSMNKISAGIENIKGTLSKRQTDTIRHDDKS